MCNCDPKIIVENCKFFAFDLIRYLEWNIMNLYLFHIEERSKVDRSIKLIAVAIRTILKYILE